MCARDLHRAQDQLRHRCRAPLPAARPHDRLHQGRPSSAPQRRNSHLLVAYSSPTPTTGSALFVTGSAFTLRDILLWCVLPVLIVLGLRLFVFGLYAIPSGSMENTIMPGDRVITTHLSPRPIALRRGDIIVFKDPGNWLPHEGDSLGSGCAAVRVSWLVCGRARRGRRRGAR